MSEVPVKKRIVTVVGGGLAGCEAAWQLARRGHRVRLIEMRGGPDGTTTPAHKTNELAEVVCSNSFGADNKNRERVSAAGILKDELELLGSFVLECARATCVPAGGALAVDRVKFSALVTDRILSNPLITLERREIHSLDELALDGDPVILATGPLTAPSLAEDLKRLMGDGENNSNKLVRFYDAVAPIVTRDSIDMSKAWSAGRYGRGDDYINCPMTREEYLAFYDALIHAERALPHDFEKGQYFEGCMPVEALADRGLDTLRFGPMKPVGLPDPKTGREPWAVVQLRQDDAAGELFNLVGFQTGLKWPEQRRVFAMIPGLEHAEIVRFGVMHRNTSVNAPLVLDKFLRLRGHHSVFLAGQVTGVEGYMESTAMGLVAGLNAAYLTEGRPESDWPDWPDETAIGSLLRYLRTTDPSHFQPMNTNLGIFPALATRIRDKKLRAAAYQERSLAALKSRRGYMLVFGLLVAILGAALSVGMLALGQFTSATDLVNRTNIQREIEITNLIEDAKSIIVKHNQGYSTVLHGAGGDGGTNYFDIESLNDLHIPSLDSEDDLPSNIPGGTCYVARRRVYDANYNPESVELSSSYISDEDLKDFPPSLFWLNQKANDPSISLNSTYLETFNSFHQPDRKNDDEPNYFYKKYGAYLIRVDVFPKGASGSSNRISRTEELFYMFK